MTVTVKLIGPLIHTVGFSEKEVELDESTTAEALLALLGIGQDRPRIVTRNGQAVAPTETFAAGDRVVVSPLYSGG